MPVSQPNSALARALSHLDKAIAIAEEHDPDGDSIPDLKRELILAQGALGFAGNSQTKLIDALYSTITTQGHTITSRVLDQAQDAIKHATGPGID